MKEEWAYKEKARTIMGDKNTGSFKNKWFRRAGLMIVVLTNIALAVIFFRNLLGPEEIPETNRSVVLSENPRRSTHDRLKDRGSVGDSTQIAITPNLREVWVAEADVMMKPEVSDAPETQKISMGKSFKVIKTVKRPPSRKSSKKKKPLKERKRRLAKKSTVTKSNADVVKTERLGLEPDNNDPERIGTVPFETIVVIAPTDKAFPDFDPKLLQLVQTVGFPGIVQNAPNGSNTLAVIQGEGENNVTLFQETPTGDNRASISQTQTALNQ